MTDGWPFRIFLDSNTLQALHEHGGSVFEGEEVVLGGRSGAAADDIAALANLFHPGLRDAFEFAVSGNSLREVADARQRGYLQWAYDVADYWDVCLREQAAPIEGWGIERAQHLDDHTFDYLSLKDRRLLRDALLYECDTFLTIEKRLPRNAGHLTAKVGIQVVRPPALWKRVRPSMRGV